MRARPVRGSPALQDILRAAMPRLVAQWDGGLDRVALVTENGPAGFIARAEAFERVVRSAPGYGENGARAAREAIEGGPAADKIDLIVDGWGIGGVMRIDTRELELYLSGDFESPVPGGSAQVMAAAGDPEVAAALIQLGAAKLPPAPSAPLQVAVDALLASPNDYGTILARVREAIVACRPFYGTAPGQSMGMVLNAIARATTARAEAIVPNARSG